MAKTKAPAAPKPVEELILHALKLAATNPKAKWLGKSPAALFNEKDENHKAAMEAATAGETPLLRKAGAGGSLTAAGFERVASALPEAEVAPLLKVMAADMPAAERVGFLQGAISRNRNIAAELEPLLQEAVAQKQAALEAESAAKVKQAAVAAANLAALKRAAELAEQDIQYELEAVKRLWVALGQKLGDLPAHEPAPPPEPKPRTSTPAPGGTRPEPRTGEERDFRRSECDRLAAAWRDAWDAKKTEGAECLVDAMWNIPGFRMIGEAGARVEFNGRYHESEQSVASGPVTIVRPGWLLMEDGGEHVALKAAVVKA
jgi:hypothetical protein